MTNTINANGNTYTDDSDPNTGMGNYGWRKRLLPMLSDVMVDVGAKLLNITGIQTDVTSKQSAVSTAATTATNAATTATNARDQAVAAANTAASLVLVKQPSEIAGIDPLVSLQFSGPNAVPTGAITGSSGKWVWRQDGTRINLPAGTAPIEYDPVTAAVRGLVIESGRANLILNSDTLTAQAVSVTAQQYTLSYYGTGTVALSGAYSATVTSAGTSPTRTTLTFTAAAGALTLTPTGTVKYAQLEAGWSATSYIPTAGSTINRAADVNAITLPYAATRGTLYAEVSWGDIAIAAEIRLDDGTPLNQASIRWGSALGGSPGACGALVNVAGATVVDNRGPSLANNAVHKIALSFGPSGYSLSADGSAVVTASAAIPSGLTRLIFGDGSIYIGRYFLRRLEFYPAPVADAILPLLTA
ncbi:hypothetical protein [Azospirillum sp. TSO5]|uniref:hypothetical protein n=1 Tax=Azospirillum sp. TSO5 TaxID=716760 RepID=UPI000D61C9FC|nr:hypothetical protein [Azospirillum sp. TSO5]PWC97733.1 hypothetical protein TSO5_04340 [Azospirillum sp. TSO5]